MFIRLHSYHSIYFWFPIRIFHPRRHTIRFNFIRMHLDDCVLAVNRKQKMYHKKFALLFAQKKHLRNRSKKKKYLKAKEKVMLDMITLIYWRFHHLTWVQCTRKAEKKILQIAVAHEIHFVAVMFPMILVNPFLKLSLLSELDHWIEGK